MPRLRALLLCLLMLALPFQGYAAAAMLACGLPQTSSHEASNAGHHDGMQHAHAQHMPGSHDSAKHAHGDAQAASAQHGHEAGTSDSGHKCSICSVCHAAALLDMPSANPVHPLPQASPAMRLVAIASAAPRLPDKPPRA